MIRGARIKLTLAYTSGIAIMMASFSTVLYVALQNVLAGNLEAGGNATAQVEQAVLSADLARARLTLAAVNVVGWLLSATVSYFIAGRTLQPIGATIERQRQFTAHASHELRTPLTIMEGEIDVTLARERTTQEYRRTLSMVYGEVDHMKRSVDDLLVLAQVDARREVTARECRELASAVNEIVRPVLPTLAAHSVRLTADIPPALEACLDWEGIYRLLRNLLDNAVRHTPPGGEIRIDASRHGSDLNLRVYNTGSRIAEPDLPHLFLPFYRGKGSASGSGSGLGLALCEWIARAHGGSVTAENLPDGVAFVVHLPRVPQRGLEG